MRKIFKYPLTIGKQTLELPSNSKILKVANQSEVLCLWALVDPVQEEKVPVEIEVVGTGHDVAFPWESYRYIDSVLMRSGSLVWHVWCSSVLPFLR